MSIDAHVSKKLRDKILCDDFIDLGSLLPKHIENETGQLQSHQVRFQCKSV